MNAPYHHLSSPDVSSFDRTSDILLKLLEREGARIKVEDILAALQDRAFAVLIVFLGLPNCLPMPPPIPLLCGLLLGLVAVQIIAGRASPWLPERLTRTSIDKAVFQKAVTKALPLLLTLEKCSRPRFLLLDTRAAFHCIGLSLLVLTIGLVLAAPFIGQIPIGLAVCIIGLGLVERDGFVVITGLMIGLAGLALNLGFAYALLKALQQWLL